jgi:hypothetical protein
MPDNERRWPKRTIRAELDGDYQGFWCVWWRNPPVSWDAQWALVMRQARTDETLRTFWTRLLDHNFVDYEGNPLPPGGQQLGDEDLQRIPNDLVDAVIEAVSRAIRDEGSTNPNG